MPSLAWVDEQDGRWIETVGMVEPLRTLPAPLTGRPCVLYQVELGLLHRLIEGVAGGVRETAGGCFRMRVGADLRILVDPSQAELKLCQKTAVRRKVRLGRDPALDARLRQLYQRLQREGPRRATVVCRERPLLAGQRVQLHGQLFRVLDVDGELTAGYRQPPRQWLLKVAELTARPQHWRS